jgi:hypothetical protein
VQINTEEVLCDAKATMFYIECHELLVMFKQYLMAKIDLVEEQCQLEKTNQYVVDFHKYHQIHSLCCNSSYRFLFYSAICRKSKMSQRESLLMLTHKKLQTTESTQ